MYLFRLCWVFLAACGLSLVAAGGGYSLLRCVGFSLQWLLLLWSTGSRPAGFSSCESWAQQLWHTGLVALRHVGSSRTRTRTRVPSIGRQILNPCATREARCGCTILHSYLHCTRVPVSSHPHQHLFFSLKKFFLIVAILINVRQYLIVTLICISLIISDVQCIFSCVCWPSVCLLWR